MPADSIKVSFNAKDNTTPVTNKIKHANSDMAGSMKKDFSGIKGSVLGAVASVGALYATIRAVASVIRTDFKFETIGTQFEILLGTAKKAKERMEDLENFSGGTPFQMEGIAKASKLLDTFSGNLLGGVNYLTIFGDAAAATSQQIEDVSMWVGRAYSAIKSGQPFGEASMRLQEMGIMTGETRQELERMRSSGASNIEIWDVFQKSLERFEGGMQKLSETGDGLVSTLNDNVILAISDLGKGAGETAKGGLQTLIDKIKELRTDGSIKEWSASFMDGIKIVGNALKSLGDTTYGKGWIGLAKFSKDSLTTLGAVGVGALGMANGMSYEEAKKAGADFGARRYTDGILGKEIKKIAVVSLGYDPLAEEARQKETFLSGKNKTPEQIEAQKKKEREAVEKDMKAAEAIKKDQDLFDELDKEYGKKVKIIKETTKKAEAELAKRQKTIDTMQKRLDAEEKKESNQKVIDDLEKKIADATQRQADAKEAMATAEEKRKQVIDDNIANFIKGFQDKAAAKKENDDANKKATDKIEKIEKKLANPNRKISRDDREFLDAEKARKAELDKQNFDINEAKRNFEEAGALKGNLEQEKNDFKKMNGTLEKIREDLATALRDPG